MKKAIATTKSVFDKLKGGASLAAFAKLKLEIVIDIMKNPLENDGIFYKHDENDMLHGFALIIGPADTIYNYGYFFFEFHYPKDYPYSPPKVKYYTNNYNIRFHPNLYRNGKVCLSLLNTWRGEQWTSCQSIKTILLTLITLFHNKPLLNEPGITEKYKYFNDYNNIIRFQNYNVAIHEVLTKKICENFCDIFSNEINKTFEKNKKIILEKLELLKIAHSEDALHLDVPLYSMYKLSLDYNLLFNKFNEFLCNKK